MSGVQSNQWEAKVINYLIAIGLSLFVFAISKKLLGNPFWDIGVYQEAVRLYNAGQNPYTTGNGLNFVYSPLVLEIFSIAGENLAIIFATLFAICVAIFTTMPMRKILIASLVLSSLFPVFQNRPAQAIMTGNITFYLHVFVIFFWLHPSGNFRKYIFPVAVIVASLFKPYFMAYAIIPILCFELSYRRLGAALFTVAVSLLFWMSQLIYNPIRFLEFTESLNAQIISDGGLGSGDIGKGFFRFFYYLTESGEISIALHILVGTAVCGAVLYFRRLVYEHPEKNSFYMVSLLALSSVILLNPRLKVYDDVLSLSMLVAFILSHPISKSLSFYSWVFIFAALANSLRILAEPDFVVEWRPALLHFSWFLHLYSPLIFSLAAIWLQSRIIRNRALTV